MVTAMTVALGITSAGNGLGMNMGARQLGLKVGTMPEVTYFDQVHQRCAAYVAEQADSCHAFLHKRLRNHRRGGGGGRKERCACGGDATVDLAALPYARLTDAAAA